MMVAAGASVAVLLFSDVVELWNLQAPENDPRRNERAHFFELQAREIIHMTFHLNRRVRAHSVFWKEREREREISYAMKYFCARNDNRFMTHIVNLVSLNTSKS